MWGREYFSKAKGQDMSKNTICLWYDKDAEAAARFYPGGKEGDALTVGWPPPPVRLPLTARSPATSRGTQPKAQPPNCQHDSITLDLEVRLSQSTWLSKVVGVVAPGVRIPLEIFPPLFPAVASRDSGRRVQGG